MARSRLPRAWRPGPAEQIQWPADRARWHCCVTPGGREATATAFLRSRGIFAFYPAETRTRWRQGRKRKTYHAVIPGFVWARFRGAPRVDALQRLSFIRGLLSQDGRLLEFAPEQIAAMKNLPAAAQRLAVRWHPGDKARITSGAATGFLVDIREIDGRGALVSFTGGPGFRARVDLDDLGDV